MIESQKHAFGGNMKGPRSQPKWQVVKRRLLDEIVGGEYRSGDALPSENYLSQTIGFARNTIRQALGQLEKEGLIFRIQGKGTFVSDRACGRDRVSSDMYGLVIPELRRDLYTSLVQGFDRGAAAEHKQVLICNTDNNVDRQGNVILKLIDQRIGGVALVPTVDQAGTAYQIRQLQQNGIPVVFCHRRVEGVSSPFLTWKWDQVGQMAGEAFWQRGHRNIGFFGVYHYQITRAYEEGLRSVLESYGGMLKPEWIYYGRTFSPDDRFADERERRLHLEKILSSGAGDRVTAVFCSDDTEAELIYYLAIQMGVKVPEELSIIGFGEHLRDGVVRRRMAAIVMDEFALGRRAVGLLGEMSSGRKAIETDEVIYKPLELIEAETLGVNRYGGRQDRPMIRISGA